MSNLVSGPHTHARPTVSWIMGQVILALVPTTLFGIYLFAFLGSCVAADWLPVIKVII